MGLYRNWDKFPVLNCGKPRPESNSLFVFCTGHFKICRHTSGNPKILVASFGTTSTGVNIKAITNIIFAQGFKSDQVIRQSIGRGLRLHSEKNKLIVFDIVDIFHDSFKTTLWKQYESRRDDIYKKQKYPFDELKIKL